jgi:hypothetical protein
MLNMRNAAIAAIASASLSLSALSAVQAQGGERTSPYKAISNTTRDSPTINRESPKPDAAFHNYVTWPEGSPDYHGSNGG